MTAPLKHSDFSERLAARPDPLAVFELRAWARAYLWAACEFDLHEAVDVLQRDAAFEGLVFEPGQDAVQAILRDAFHQFRERGP